MIHTKLANILEIEVRNERDRQDSVWGEQNHEDGTGPLTEPLSHITGSHMTATTIRPIAQDFSSGRVTWAKILLEEVFEALAEEDHGLLYTELTQVEAVARAWREAIIRRGDV